LLGSCEANIKYILLNQDKIQPEHLQAGLHKTVRIKAIPEHWNIHIEADVSQLRQAVNKTRPAKNYMNYRKTKYYKNLTPYTACETVEWSETATQKEQLIAWQYLLDTGQCWKLQGWYKRTAAYFIEEGLIERK